LRDAPNVKFYALQKGAREEEAQNPPEGFAVTNLGPEIKDLTDLAALIEALDLLITVDTAPAHLAGALGRPVWVMLPLASDWRWMLQRPDSPWYPSMRLFRQGRMNDWTGATAQIRTALQTC